MAYQIDPNTVDTANGLAFAALKTAEIEAINSLGIHLDSTFNAVWSPPAPATVAGVVAACGTNFMARCAMHAALANLLLQQEAANGIDSSRHPWTIPQPGGGFVPGIPAGWTVTPTLDGSGNPIGAATVSYAAS